LLFGVSAGLLTVIQAPMDWSFLAWVALVPFVLACSPQARDRTSTGSIQPRLVLPAFGVGFLYWLGNLYWITPITLIGWTAMVFYLAWFWPLLAIPVRFCRSKGIPMFLALPVLVVGAERLQGFPMGGFFWRFLGHSQYANLPMIQIADIFGAAGVSFVVAMVNGLLADIALRLRIGGPDQSEISDLKSATARTSPMQAGGQSPPYMLFAGTAVTLIVVAATIGYGQWRLRQTGEYLREGPRVASLQSNVPQSVKKSFSRSGQLFDDLMAQSKAALGTGAELIVWPETMVQGLLDPKLWPYLANDVNDDKAFHYALCNHAKGNAYLLVGALGADILRDPAGERYLGTYNSAYLYCPDGTRDPQRYDKIHLVLFGEYTPFRRSFPWLFQQLGRFLPDGYNVDYSLEHGKNYTVFEMATPVHREDPNSPASPAASSSVKGGGLGDGAMALPESHRQAALDDATRRNPQLSQDSPYHFAVIICYEDTVPYVARNFTLDERGRKRIDWLVNISNDGWFVRFIENLERVVPSTELPQHAAVCAFRAVENRLPILRSVNTGISCLIESTGRIRNGYFAASDKFPTEAMDRTGLTGWFSDRLPIDTRVTFYSRHGEWFATSCVVLLIAAVSWPLGSRIARRRLRKAA
jgi:apolipoprotein N-acyltransferase